MTIPKLVANQKKTYRSGVTRPEKWRTEQLKQLRKLLVEREKELCDAIREDFGKPYFESYTGEIYTVLKDIDYQLKHLGSWMKPELVGGPVVNFPSKNTVYKQPLGTVLIIGAWNYPIQLTLMPLVGAISAGNTAIVKPSELAPATSSALHKFFKLYFEPDVLAVVEGGVEETQELLRQPIDKIFFTGSTRVGKIIMKAAAEQLIPVTLELGGKSPAIVHSDANIEISTKRIWWGKCVNAGQVCVAPDFVLVHESLKEAFIENSKKTLSAFYRDDYQIGSNYTRIINNDHFDRLKKLLDKSNIIFGGTTNKENRFIEPTLVEAGWDGPVMQDEIFGPILPLLTYEGEDEMIQKLGDRPSSLALYLFTESSELQDKIVENVSFGGGCVNDTLIHLANPRLPFGGVGQSGMGSYHGRKSFDTFSRQQSLLKKSIWPDPDFRYPPYDDSVLSWFKKLFT